ncbi:MAG: YbhB/YbcL family Raf kinase inhibitor-like protein [Halobacteriaceae archaeon]
MGLTLTSPVFDDGDAIPDRYGREYDNVNPPLTIEDVPADAESLALVLDDPDAEAIAGKVWDHWVVWNVPATAEGIPENGLTDGAVEGTNDFDEVGYDGPAPPEEEHTYRFELYALDTALDLSTDAGADELRTAVTGHVLDSTTLAGTFSP